MGNFISRSDLEEYLSDDVVRDLTDDDASGLENVDPYTKCIAGAEAEVTGYLTKRYGYPLDTDLYSDAGLQEIATVLAALRLYSRRRSVPEHMAAEAVRVRQWLSDISTGVTDVNVDVTEPDSKAAEFTYEDRQFSRSLGDKGWETW